MIDEVAERHWYTLWYNTDPLGDAKLWQRTETDQRWVIDIEEIACATGKLEHQRIEAEYFTEAVMRLLAAGYRAEEPWL